MVSLAEQFRIFIEGQDTNILSDSIVLLRFATSAEHPLTMGEISYFLGEIQDFLESHNIEWCSETDITLGGKVHFTCYSYPQNMERVTTDNISLIQST